jgi:hypothetical protein
MNITLELFRNTIAAIALIFNLSITVFGQISLSRDSYIILSDEKFIPDSLLVYKKDSCGAVYSMTGSLYGPKERRRHFFENQPYEGYSYRKIDRKYRGELHGFSQVDRYYIGFLVESVILDSADRVQNRHILAYDSVGCKVLTETFLSYHPNGTLESLFSSTDEGSQGIDIELDTSGKVISLDSWEKDHLTGYYFYKWDENVFLQSYTLGSKEDYDRLEFTISEDRIIRTREHLDPNSHQYLRKYNLNGELIEE